MVPIRLQIRNFLSYGEPPQEINFEGIPLVALVGPNGAGKSSLLDAITWALFGDALRFGPRREIKWSSITETKARGNEELIRKGATEMSVSLEFEVDGQKFRVHRRFSRRSGKQEATLEQFNGEKWHTIVAKSGVTTVNKEIKRLLRMDSDTFIRTAIIRQGESGEFMKLGSVERRDFLAKTLDLGVYEELAEKAKKQVEFLTGQINEGERRIGEIKSELQKRAQTQQEFEKKEREREHMEIALKQLDEEISQVQQRREKLLAEKARLEQLLSEQKSIQQNIAELQKTITDYQSQLERWEEILTREGQIVEEWQEFSRVQKVEAALTEKANKLRELEQQRHQLEQSILKAKAKLENELRAREESKFNISERVKELQSLLSKRPEVEQKIAELQKARVELTNWDEKQKLWQAIQQRRSQIEQAIAAEKARFEQRESELKRTRQQFESRTAQKPVVEEQLKRLEEAKRKLDEWQQKRESALSKRENVASQIAMLEARQEQLQRAIAEVNEKLHLLEIHAGEPKCPLCETMLTPQKVAALKRKLTREKEEREAELEDVMEQKANLERSREQLNAFVAQAESELQKLPEIDQRLGKVREQLAQLEEAEKEIERLSEELEALSQQRKEAERKWASQLGEIEEQERSIGYDPTVHQQVRQKVESLAKSEVEMEQIRNAEEELKLREGQLRDLEAEIETLKRKLLEEDFAHEERTQLEQVNEAVRTLGYDQSQHQQVRVWLQKNQHILQWWQQLQTAKEQVPQLKNWIENAKRQVAENEKRVNEIAAQVEELNLRTAKLPEFEEQLKDLKGRRKARENELHRLREEIGALRNMLENLSRLEQEKIQLEQRLKQLLGEKQDYELLTEAFGRNGIPKRILNSAVQWLEWEANQLLARLTQGRMHLRFVLEMPTQKGSQRETLKIIVADELGDRPYELYSGGEKFRIDIALRIALARLLAYRSGAPLRTLIIDEGFGSQDKEGLDTIAETIKSVAKEFSRVIVVTHLDEFRDYFPALIEVTKSSTGSQCRLIVRDQQEITDAVG